MTYAAWCSMLVAIIRLVAGKPVPEQALRIACANLECELVAHHADLVLAISDSVATATVWHVCPLLTSEGIVNAWVRVSPLGGECLTDQREDTTDVWQGILGGSVGWRALYLNEDDRGVALLELGGIPVCSDARRRVLAQELYALLPADLQCN